MLAEAFGYICKQVLIYWNIVCYHAAANVQ